MTNSPKRSRPTGTPAQIESVLDAYCPTGLAEPAWARLLPDVKALVLKAGPLTQIRVEHDVQAIAAVARHLVQQGRPLTLDEVLADSTLLSFDQSLRSSGRKDRTREKLRGVLRRLQAAHHDVPWRAPRRADGARVGQMPSPQLAGDLARLEEQAGQHAAEGHAGAADLLEVVTAERSDRRKAVLDPVVWDRARRYADNQDVALTRSMLSSAVTHQVLLLPEPVAVLALVHGLSRCDLDLGLTHVTALSDLPSEGHRRALRGTWPPPTPDC